MSNCNICGFVLCACERSHARFRWETDFTKSYLASLRSSRPVVGPVKSGDPDEGDGLPSEPEILSDEDESGSGGQ